MHYSNQFNPIYTAQINTSQCTFTTSKTTLKTNRWYKVLIKILTTHHLPLHYPVFISIILSISLKDKERIKMISAEALGFLTCRH